MNGNNRSIKCSVFLLFLNGEIHGKLNHLILVNRCTKHMVKTVYRILCAELESALASTDKFTYGNDECFNNKSGCVVRDASAVQVTYIYLWHQVCI